MAAFTSVANTGATEMDLISSIVQDQLLEATMLRPTVEDHSDKAGKGIKSIELPRFASRFSGPAAQNPDGATPTTSQTVDFATDVIPLSDWTSMPYEVPDRVSKQSMISLEAELAKSAGREYGIYMDTQIIAKLRLAADGTGGLPDHRIQLTGGTNDKITLDDIAEARRLLNVANVPQSDRYLVISPDQEKAMLGISNFIKANEYGSREALLKGEIGQVFGFRVLVHNGLNAAEACAYHKSAVGVAVQKEVSFETRRMDLALQSTQYCFSMGMGQAVLDEGRRQVLLNSTGT